MFTMFFDIVGIFRQVAFAKPLREKNAKNPTPKWPFLDQKTN